MSFDHQRWWLPGEKSIARLEPHGIGCGTAGVCAEVCALFCHLQAFVLPE
jgi:hypothetical protein